MPGVAYPAVPGITYPAIPGIAQPAAAGGIGCPSAAGVYPLPSAEALIVPTAAEFRARVAFDGMLIVVVCNLRVPDVPSPLGDCAG